MSLVPVHSPTVFAVRGSSDVPVTRVGLANLTIAHAAPTFMEPYEMSSGGDVSRLWPMKQTHCANSTRFRITVMMLPLLDSQWAIHRGAAVFVDGAEHVNIEGNHFDQVDGNGGVSLCSCS